MKQRHVWNALNQYLESKLQSLHLLTLMGLRANKVSILRNCGGRLSETQASRKKQFMKKDGVKNFKTN